MFSLVFLFSFAVTLRMSEILWFVVSTSSGPKKGLIKRLEDIGRKVRKPGAKGNKNRVAKVARSMASKVNKTPTKEPEPRKTRQRGKAEADGAAGEIVQPWVKKARMAYTVVTSTWGDGTIGPLCIQFSPSSHVSPQICDVMNQRYEGRLWVTINKRETHFFDSESTLCYWHGCLTPGFQHRRRILQEMDDWSSSDRKGAIMFDQFTGNESGT